MCSTDSESRSSGEHAKDRPALESYLYVAHSTVQVGMQTITDPESAAQNSPVQRSHSISIGKVPPSLKQAGRLHLGQRPVRRQTQNKIHKYYATAVPMFRFRSVLGRAGWDGLEAKKVDVSELGRKILAGSGWG